MSASPKRLLLKNCHIVIGHCQHSYENKDWTTVKECEFTRGESVTAGKGCGVDEIWDFRFKSRAFNVEFMAARL
jgi:hypothetical protein